MVEEFCRVRDSKIAASQSLVSGDQLFRAQRADRATVCLRPVCRKTVLTGQGKTIVNSRRQKVPILRNSVATEGVKREGTPMGTDTPEVACPERRTLSALLLRGVI